MCCACAAEPVAQSPTSTTSEPTDATTFEQADTTTTTIFPTPPPLPTEQDARTARLGLDLWATSGEGAIIKIPRGNAQTQFNLFSAWTPFFVSPADWPHEWSLAGLLIAHPPLTWISTWPDAGRTPLDPLIVSLLEPAPPALQTLLAGGGAGITRVWVQTDDADAQLLALQTMLIRAHGFVRVDAPDHPKSPLTIRLKDLTGSTYARLRSHPSGERVEIFVLRVGCEPTAGVEHVWRWIEDAQNKIHAVSHDAASLRILQNTWARTDQENPAMFWRPERLLDWADGEVLQNAQRPILETFWSDRLRAWALMEILRTRRLRWMYVNSPSAPGKISVITREQDGRVRIHTENPLYTEHTHTIKKPWPLRVSSDSTQSAPFLEFIWQTQTPIRPTDPHAWDLEDWPELGQIIRHPGLLSPWHVVPLLRDPEQALQHVAAFTLGLNDTQRAHMRGLHLALQGWPSERAGTSIRGALAIVFDDMLTAHQWLHQAHRWSQRQSLAIDFALLPTPLGVAVIASQHTPAASAFAFTSTLTDAQPLPVDILFAWTPLQPTPSDDTTPIQTPTPLVITACAYPWGWTATLLNAPEPCTPDDNRTQQQPAPPIPDKTYLRRAWAILKMIEGHIAAARFRWDRAQAAYLIACDENLTGACALAARTTTRAHGPTFQNRPDIPPYILNEPLFDDALFLLLDPEHGAWINNQKISASPLTLPTPEILAVLRQHLNNDGTTWHLKPIVLDIPAHTPWYWIAPWLDALGSLGAHQHQVFALAEVNPGQHPIVIPVATLHTNTQNTRDTQSPTQTPYLPRCEHVASPSAMHIPAGNILETTPQPLSLTPAPDTSATPHTETHCNITLTLYPERLVLEASPQSDTKTKDADTILIGEEFESIDALYEWIAADTPHRWARCEATLFVSSEIAWERVLSVLASLRHRRNNRQDWEPEMTPLSTYKEKGDDFKESIGEQLHPVDLLPLLQLSLTQP